MIMWRNICLVPLALILSQHVLSWEYKKKQYTWSRDENDVLKSNSDIRMRFPRYSIELSDFHGDSPFKFSAGKSDDFFISERSRKSVVVYPKEELACTSRNYTENLKTLRKNVNCKLRSRLVELEGARGEVIFPKTVVLKHCEGDCIGGKACVPNRVREVEFYVRKFWNRGSVCSVIKVLEATSCRCGCANRNSCPKTHKLTAGCKCICRNEKEYKSCTQKEGLQWNNISCRCECQNKQFCTTGSEWSEKTCRCEKLQ